jgi:hypothetical protein
MGAFKYHIAVLINVIFALIVAASRLEVTGAIGRVADYGEVRF